MLRNYILFRIATMVASSPNPGLDDNSDSAAAAAATPDVQLPSLTSATRAFRRPLLDVSEQAEQRRSRSPIPGVPLNQ